QGAKFCSHCGAKVEHPEATTTTRRSCPCCRVPMESIVLGKTRLLECTKCEGLWADTATLEQICADREQQTAVLGMPATLPDDPPGNIEAIRYRPCPVCGDLMNRVNFAQCSHVIVDVCRAHGTWFDKDELRRIVEFIRLGGMDKVRAQQI